MSKKYVHRYAMGIGALSLGLVAVAYFNYPKPILEKETLKPIEIAEEITSPSNGSNYTLQSKKGHLSLFCCDEKVEGKNRWIIVLENFTSIHIPYIEIKRIVQQGEKKADYYLPLTRVLDEEKAPHEKIQLLPELAPISIGPWGEIHLESAPTSLGDHPAITLTEKGFLPGERIHIRVLHGDTFNDIDFIPIPILFKNGKEKEIGHAELLSINPTTYAINLDYDKNNPIWRYQSLSYDEVADQMICQTEPINIALSQEVINKSEGTGRFICSYLDGSSYEIALPWGDHLRPYIFENELNPYLKKQESNEEIPPILNDTKIGFYPYFAEDKVEDGFIKWVLVLEEFDSNAPTRDLPLFETQRPLLVDLSESEYAALAKMTKDSAQYVTFKTADNEKVEKGEPPIVIISSQGYLPGEKVTFRVRHRDDPEGECISFCPYPLTFRNPNGNELATIELVHLKPAIYEIAIHFNPNNKLKKIETISLDGKDEMDVYSESTFYHKIISPQGADSEGGMVTLNLTYEDGNCYSYELPWGNEFKPYMLGKVQNSF